MKIRGKIFLRNKVLGLVGVGDLFILGDVPWIVMEEILGCIINWFPHIAFFKKCT